MSARGFDKRHMSAGRKKCIEHRHCIVWQRRRSRAQSVRWIFHWHLYAGARWMSSCRRVGRCRQRWRAMEVYESEGMLAPNQLRWFVRWSQFIFISWQRRARGLSIMHHRSFEKKTTKRRHYATSYTTTDKLSAHRHTHSHTLTPTNTLTHAYARLNTQTHTHTHII